MSYNILKISEATSLGIHSLVVLAQNPSKLISVKEISEVLCVSANHLSKVMQRLNKAGYIDSIKGFNGGFKLTCKPEKTTILEVYELFEGKLDSPKCLLNREGCIIEECMLGGFISSINKQVKTKFEETKISDLT